MTVREALKARDSSGRSVLEFELSRRGRFSLATVLLGCLFIYAPRLRQYCGSAFFFRVILCQWTLYFYGLNYRVTEGASCYVAVGGVGWGPARVTVGIPHS